MPLRIAIYRALIILALLCPALAGAESAPHGQAGTTDRTAIDGTSRERRRLPQDAVLTGIARVSPAASIQSSHTGGGNGFAALCTALPATLWQPHVEDSTAFRRWQILHSAVLYGQLRGRYPTHAFW